MTEKDVFMVRCEVEGIRSNLEKLNMTREPVEYWFLRGLYFLMWRLTSSAVRGTLQMITSF